MPTILAIQDETTAGAITNRRTLEFPTESVTVREIIRARVYEEVQDYNRARATPNGGVFNGLVQPSDTEVALNGVKSRGGREIDWKKQFEIACDAYDRAGFIVLAGQRQTESLDEVVELKRVDEVTFLKLVPLVGGDTCSFARERQRVLRNS